MLQGPMGPCFYARLPAFRGRRERPPAKKSLCWMSEPN